MASSSTQNALLAFVVQGGEDREHIAGYLGVRNVPGQPPEAGWLARTNGDDEVRFIGSSHVPTREELDDAVEQVASMTLPAINTSEEREVTQMLRAANIEDIPDTNHAHQTNGVSPFIRFAMEHAPRIRLEHPSTEIQDVLRRKFKEYMDTGTVESPAKLVERVVYVCTVVKEGKFYSCAIVHNLKTLENEYIATDDTATAKNNGFYVVVNNVMNNFNLMDKSFLIISDNSTAVGHFDKVKMTNPRDKSNMAIRNELNKYETFRGSVHQPLNKSKEYHPNLQLAHDKCVETK